MTAQSVHGGEHCPMDPGLLRREILVGAGVWLLSLAVCAYVTHHLLVHPQTNQLDVQISRTVYAWRSPAATVAMLVLSNVGGEWFVPTASVTIIALMWKRHRKVAAVFALTLLAGFLLNLAIKDLVQRPRPMMAPLIFVDGNSYPSGHAMNALVFYALVVYTGYHLTARARNRALMLAVAIPLVFMIGFSRIYLGAHYPTDVVCGFFAGLWWFVSALMVERTLSRRAMRKALVAASPAPEPVGAGAGKDAG